MGQLQWIPNSSCNFFQKQIHTVFDLHHTVRSWLWSVIIHSEAIQLTKPNNRGPRCGPMFLPSVTKGIHIPATIWQSQRYLIDHPSGGKGDASLKCFLCTCEIGPPAATEIKNGVRVCAFNPSHRRWRQKDPRDLLASQWASSLVRDPAEKKK